MDQEEEIRLTEEGMRQHAEDLFNADQDEANTELPYADEDD